VWVVRLTHLGAELRHAASVGDTVAFDPSAIDRAIGHLARVLELMDGNEGRIGELQRVTQPGAAPSTRAFHGLLGQSMGKLKQQHDAFRVNVQNQIEELKRTKLAYTAADRRGASAFTTLNGQM
jgi:hypothetical protein